MMLHTPYGSEIYHRQDLQTQGHYGKVKSNFFQNAHLDTMGDKKCPDIPQGLWDKMHPN